MWRDAMERQKERGVRRVIERWGEEGELDE